MRELGMGMPEWMRGPGWMREFGWGLVVKWLLALGLAGAGGYAACAQITTVAVRDTVYSASGEAASGTLVVSWDAFTTASGAAVAAGTTSAAIGADGVVSVNLAPNDGATPAGSFYTAVYHLSDGSTSTEYWTVPAAAAGVEVTIGSLRSSLLPASVAVQTVSKQYVDAAIASAATGAPVGSLPYVSKAGDTLMGPLALPGDPAQDQEAADKHYVDAQVNGVSTGLVDKVSFVPSATQSVLQPLGTQLQVNALNGELYASRYVSGPGDNGLANVLTSTACLSGCRVKAEPTYSAQETLAAFQIPDFGHVVDQRGGTEAHVFANPLGQSTGDLSAGSSWAQLATRSTPALKALRPSIFGQASVTMSLANAAMAGGSNQFPSDIESVPYGKNTYGVTTATGNYNTQGQHVQSTNYINCYGVGDCLAGSLYLTSSGGYRDVADEGAHPFDRQVLEDSRVFQGRCASGCTAGSTAVMVSATAAGGTQGDGRFLIDKNPSKVISTGALVSGGRGLLGTATFAGTSFPGSVFLQTTAKATSQAADLAPGTVTLAIVTSGVPSGFATSTAALPVPNGVACVADSEAGGSVFPNFETATYAVVDASHLRMTLGKVHAAGAVIAVGGLCGYGLEQTVDTANGIRQVFPVVGSSSGTSLFYADALTTVVGLTNEASTSGYQHLLLPIASVTRSGGVATVRLVNGMPQDVNGLSVTVSGVADASFNGSAAVTTTGSATLTYPSAGDDGGSTGGSLELLTGGYAIYPMAEVRSVWNPATKLVDGLLTLAPNTVNWEAGDSLEEPHYHQQYTFADTEYVRQVVPRTIAYVSSGKEYDGAVGPGVRGWQIANGVAKSNYLGAGGTHRPPDDAHLVTGVWRNDFEVDAGQEAVLRIHCNLRGCNRWNSSYAVLAMDAAVGQDYLTYNPENSTAQFVMGAGTYGFSPQAFTAPAIQAGTVSASTVNAGVLNSEGLRATGGSLDGVVIGASTAAAATVRRLDVMNTGADPGAGYATANLTTTGPNGYGPSFLFDATSMGGHKYTVYSSGPQDAGGAGLFAIYDNTAVAGRFTISPGGTITMSGPVSVAQLLGDGATPTAAAGAGAGAGATVQVSGSALAGLLTLTTGNGTAANATVATVSFAEALGTAPQGCSLMPRSANAAGVAVFTGAPTAAGWPVGATVALPVGATLVWSYQCL